MVQFPTWAMDCWGNVAWLLLYRISFLWLRKMSFRTSHLFLQCKCIYFPSWKHRHMWWSSTSEDLPRNYSYVYISIAPCPCVQWQQTGINIHCLYENLCNIIGHFSVRIIIFFIFYLCSLKVTEPSLILNLFTMKFRFEVFHVILWRTNDCPGHI